MALSDIIATIISRSKAIEICDSLHDVQNATTDSKLIFGGSGVKTLQGNVVVNTTAGGSWSITGTATVNMNGFTITTI